MRVEQAKVPTELRRKAAQHLESLRGTELAPNAERARLSEWACPVYRPDLDEVAYYEFEVDLGRGLQRVVTQRLLTSTAPRQSKALLSERAKLPPAPVAAGAGGFIVVATGPHDFPVPHWSLDRAAPSRQLEAAAEGGKIARVVKLDALAYAAEDEDGGLVAQTGQLPTAVQGLPHDLRRAAGVSTLVAEPRSKGGDDGKLEGEHAVKRTGKGQAKLEPLKVESWAELKAAYADAFGPFLDDLRRQAAHAWSVDELVEKLGEGIYTGTAHRVALLEPDAKAELSGPGAEVVRLKLVEGGGQPALELRADEKELDRELDLELRIGYDSGLQETLRFFVVSRRTPTNRHEQGEEG